MNEYLLYIKTGLIGAGDFEAYTEAQTKEEAVGRFARELELDKKTIEENLLEV